MRGKAGIVREQEEDEGSKESMSESVLPILAEGCF